MKTYGTIHPDLLAAQKLAYEPSNLICSNITPEAESLEYGACQFVINSKTTLFRTAKTTPTKIGQFVAIWKRIGSGPIMPYDMQDPVDLFVISVRNGKHFGQFVFPKAVLHKKGFISENGQGGKRAMRVYPPWVTPTSKQAQKTQAWQLMYFVDMSGNKDVDISLIKKLFS